MARKVPRDGSLLAALAPLGEYFTVDRVPDEPSDPPLAELYAGHPRLRDYIHQVATALRTDEDRVGASILVQGLAARLWSVGVASVLFYDHVPDLAPAATWWAPRHHGGRLRILDRPDLSGAPDPSDGPDPSDATDPTEGPDPSGVPDLPGADLPVLPILEHSTHSARGDAVHHDVVATHLVGLIDAVRTHVKLPATLLWGNAASALVGTVGVLVGVRPALEPAGARLVADLLTRPPLAGVGEAPTLTGFVRNSCCLYYRVPGGGLCGDCPLHRKPAD
jgi:hypothetical protein